MTKKKGQVRYSPTSTSHFSVFLGAEGIIPSLTSGPSSHNPHCDAVALCRCPKQRH